MNSRIPETSADFLPHSLWMNRNLTQKEVEVLKALLDYGVLTVSQLSLLCCPSRQMARKKAREFANRGLVRLIPRDFNQHSGRPEAVMVLTASALQILNNSGCLDREMRLPRMMETHLHDREHKILINWVRLHLNWMEMNLPEIKINFLSPIISCDAYRLETNESGVYAVLIPDGIFSITDVKQGKSLLFFLEVDMGTESIASSKPGESDVKKKILGYQSIFRSKLHKGLENLFKASFTGFRTLFLAVTEPRFRQLCRLVRSIPSSDFVWLTYKDRLFQQGVSDRIWVKGGREENGRYSILGPSLAFKCHIPLA